ncbi:MULTISPECIES: NAD(P)-dependent alcohol dehydrogenase [Dermacoccus]|nr:MULTISPECIES: NAD(P)-dependent alcohol dehydrogenase [Dermacoccus]EFP58900.1 putative chlorophyll synthesis pathway protein BchC [Dermacoccus sp. Ellin185]MCT1604754.1 NAD(P)-dependent alcohol dehydrogenase [Dermacoccus nishinomiyaensis]TCJ91909.1 L-iditol 2-dehydrogenase [Dermacoccus sp. SAI-028]
MTCDERNPMRVLELSAPETLTLTQRDVPTPGPGQVLVRMTCVGVCGSDTHYLTHGRIGSYAVDYPMVLGHEGAGVVEAVGEGVDASRIGERVSIEPGVPCRTCAQCLAGAYNLCPDMVFHATPPYDGSLAECIVHDAAFAHPVPDGVSDEAAAMVEPLSVGLWACRKADVTLGDRVLITGCGPIGLMCLLAARARGARDITVVDLNPERLERARALGARVVDSRHERFDEREYDVLLECSGVASVTLAGMRALARGARAVLVGMGGDTVELPLSALQEREVSATGVFRYANTWPQALAMLAGGVVEVDDLVTGRFDLADGEQALRAGLDDPASVKAMIYPNGLPTV